MIGVHILFLTSILTITLTKPENISQSTIEGTTTRSSKICDNQPKEKGPEQTLQQYYDEQTKMRSCENRCGIPKTTHSLNDFYCQCDDKCIHFEDCCADFNAQCTQNSSSLNDETQLKGQRSRYTCVKISNTNMVYTSSNCRPEYASTVLESMCKYGKKFLDTVPVTDQETNRTYKNIHCARCNNVKAFTNWEIKLLCNAYVMDENDFLNPGTTTLLKLLTSRFCEHHYVPPVSTDSLRSCLPTLDTCPKGTNETLADMCATSGFYPLVYQSLTAYVYKNFYCWVCSTSPILDDTGKLILPNCKLGITQIQADDKSGLDLSVFSFGILWDLTSENDLLMITRPGKGINGMDFGISCDANAACTTLKCPEGYVHDEKKCVLDRLIVPTVLKCLGEVNDTENIEIGIKTVFAPMGYISAFEHNKYFYKYFKFDTIFPRNFTKGMIQKAMDGYTATFIRVTLFAVNVTFDFSIKSIPTISHDAASDRNSTPKFKHTSSDGNYNFTMVQLIMTCIALIMV
ncbi:unnamed protein product [Owenia fusiformis]|uniref:Uncharacterized protein n=1 Tax=Owenia fusiformis TaxID=6347 RepID=A0A8J1ULQ1_OWEFU|nr:unnamed protein product [Owenia fusiformis]